MQIHNLEQLEELTGSVTADLSPEDIQEILAAIRETVQLVVPVPERGFLFVVLLDAFTGQKLGVLDLSLSSTPEQRARMNAVFTLVDPDQVVLVQAALAPGSTNLPPVLIMAHGDSSMWFQEMLARIVDATIAGVRFDRVDDKRQAQPRD